MTSKRTPEEILKAIEEPPSFDEELDRVMAMTPEQRRAELEGADFDLNELHAEADAWAARMKEEPEAPAPEAPPVAVAAVAQVPVPRRTERGARRRPTPMLVWLVAAAAVTVAGGALYVALHPTPGPPIAPLPPEPSTPAPIPSAIPDLVAAAELRRLAAAACDAQQWSACVAHLDEARTVDPDGDDAPPVRTLRDKANREMQRKQ